MQRLARLANVAPKSTYKGCQRTGSHVVTLEKKSEMNRIVGAKNLRSHRFRSVSMRLMSGAVTISFSSLQREVFMNYSDGLFSLLQRCNPWSHQLCAIAHRLTWKVDS
jgi:hypothetical protein